MISIINFALSVFPTWFGVLILILFAIALLILLFRVISAVIDAIPFL